MANEIPVSATFIFVDRRKTGRGKSLPNRQKLLKRITDSIKNSKPQDIDANGVQSASTAPSKQLKNPVRVAREALSEPTFAYQRKTGDVEIILPGNDKWLKGDEFPMEDEDEAGTGGGLGEDGEDDFVINVSRDEYYDVYFADCELPDLEQSTEKELPQAQMKPAGFKNDGTPGQFSVIRSFKNSLGRRKALTFDIREEMAVLEERLEALMSDNVRDAADHEEWCFEVKAITERIQEIKDKIAGMPVFEEVDHRYRKTERVLVKSADAAFIMAMDISASMDEEKKRTARKFFSLQYAFIVRKYPNTDLAFIWHTSEAEECDEETFFTTRKNGGTIVSTAIVVAHKIIKERYDTAVTNIYFSYAGDLDNFEVDNSVLITELEEKMFLNKLRHAVFSQVGEEMPGWGGTPGGQLKCWTALKAVQASSKKMHLVKIEDDEAVFDAFKKIYGKKNHE
jgi:uncharacterized sporulation protein YeaH/YhbH (DUF444 family)